jgi:hypothetical protein
MTAPAHNRPPPDFDASPLLAHWPGVLFRQRPDFTMLWISPRVAEWTGLPPAAWLEGPAVFWRVLQEEDAAAVRQRLEACAAAREGFTHSFRLRHVANGRLRMVSEYRQPLLDRDGRPAGSHGFWVDVTSQRLLESRLVVAAWEAALPGVIQGFKHDLSSTLTGAVAMSDLCLQQLQPGERFHEELSLAKLSARQASDLMGHLAKLVGGSDVAQPFQELNQLVADVVKWVRRVVRHRTVLTLQWHGAEPVISTANDKTDGWEATLDQAAAAARSLPIAVNEMEVQQALAHLIFNALPEATSRTTLSIRTFREDTDPGGGRGACAGVALLGDSPADVAEEARALAEPLHITCWTQPTRKWGLAAARLLVERNRGGLTVASAGAGRLEWRLWLPLANLEG